MDDEAETFSHIAEAGELFSKVGPALHGADVRTILLVFGGVIGSMSRDKDDLIDMLTDLNAIAHSGLRAREQHGLSIGYTASGTETLQ